MEDLRRVLKELHLMLASLPDLENACDDYGRNALQLRLDSDDFRDTLKAYLDQSKRMESLLEPERRLKLSVQMSQLIAEIGQPGFARNGRRIVESATTSAGLISEILEQ